MIEEKRLIKKEKHSILKKAIDFIKKLFSGKKEETFSKNIEHNKKNNTLIDELQKNRKLLNIQQRFENGTIQEENLTEEEKNDLIKLYYQQINDLDKDIQNYKRTLEFYNEKILITQKNLNPNN